MSTYEYKGGDYLVKGGRSYRGPTPEDPTLFLSAIRPSTTSYTPEFVLVPDTISDACGRIAAFCIEGYPVLAYRTPRSVRVADMGCGSGVFLSSMLNGIKVPSSLPMYIDAIDIDEEAIKTTHLNVSSAITGVPRSVYTDYKQGDYAEELSGFYDIIFFNPPYLEPGHEITNHQARSGPQAALFVERSTNEYERVVPNLDQYLTKKGVAFVRLPRQDPKVDAWLLKFFTNHSHARILEIQDNKERQGRVLAIFKTTLPDAFAEYDYWENYIGGDERRQAAKSDRIPIYGDDSAEAFLLRHDALIKRLSQYVLLKN